VALLNFARWPDGSFSLVHAGDEQDAYVQLDELGVEPGGAQADGVLLDRFRVKRFQSFEPSPASTEVGKALQTHLAGSGHYVDALVEMVAEERLLKEEDDENRKPN
jgi:hypothetical protein